MSFLNLGVEWLWRDMQSLGLLMETHIHHWHHETTKGSVSNYEETVFIILLGTANLPGGIGRGW